MIPGKRSIRIALASVLLAGLAFASQSQAAVLRVVVVQTDNVSGYVKELEKGQAILKRIGSSATLRVFRARYAGPETGTVIVVLEYPSFVVFAQDDTKANANPEYSAWLSGMAKLRKVVSDSTYDELKP